MTYDEVKSRRAVKVGYLGLIYRLDFGRAIAAFVHEESKLLERYLVEHVVPFLVVVVKSPHVDKVIFAVLTEFISLRNSAFGRVARIVRIELRLEFGGKVVRPLLSAYFGAAVYVRRSTVAERVVVHLAPVLTGKICRIGQSRIVKPVGYLLAVGTRRICSAVKRCLRIGAYELSIACIFFCAETASRRELFSFCSLCRKYIVERLMRIGCGGYVVFAGIENICLCTLCIVGDEVFEIYLKTYLLGYALFDIVGLIETDERHGRLFNVVELIIGRLYVNLNDFLAAAFARVSDLERNCYVSVRIRRGNAVVRPFEGRIRKAVAEWILNGFRIAV